MNNWGGDKKRWQNTYVFASLWFSPVDIMEGEQLESRLPGNGKESKSNQESSRVSPKTYHCVWRHEWLRTMTDNKTSLYIAS